MTNKKSTAKKKYVTVTGKNGGKIKTTVGSNTYNTLIKNGGSVSGGSSGSSSSSTYSSVGKTRDQILADAQKTVAAIQKGFAESKDTFSQGDLDKFGAGLQGTQSSLDKYVATQPKAVQDRVALAKATAPTNAGLVTTPMTPPTVPTTTPDTPGIADATAGVAGLSTENQKMADFAAKQEADRIKREEARQKESKTLMDKFLGNMTSPSEARTDAWDETGMDVQKYFAKQEAGIKEIESLTNEYNAVTAARDQQIAQTNDAMGSMNFINNQTAQIERNAAPKLNRLSADINAKAATLQAQQGNYAEARAYVNDAVSAATADAKFKFDMYSVFYDENKDNFDRIESIYTDAYKTQMDIAKQEYDAQLAEKELIGEYMLKYPSAGLKMTDSIEEASRKISAVSGTTVDLTADQKNYEYAVAGGYEGSFADWIGKGGGVSDDVEGLVIALYNKQIGIGDVPSELRNSVLSLYNKMVELDKTEESTPEESQITTPTSLRERLNLQPVGTTIITAPAGNYANSSPAYSYFGTPERQATTTAVWGNLFGS